MLTRRNPPQRSLSSILGFKTTKDVKNIIETSSKPVNFTGPKPGTGQSPDFDTVSTSSSSPTLSEATSKDSESEERNPKKSLDHRNQRIVASPQLNDRVVEVSKDLKDELSPEDDDDVSKSSTLKSIPSIISSSGAAEIVGKDSLKTSKNLGNDRRQIPPTIALIDIPGNDSTTNSAVQVNELKIIPITPQLPKTSIAIARTSSIQPHQIGRRVSTDKDGPTKKTADQSKITQFRIKDIRNGKDNKLHLTNTKKPSSNYSTITDAIGKSSLSPNKIHKDETENHLPSGLHILNQRVDYLGHEINSLRLDFDQKMGEIILRLKEMTVSIPNHHHESNTSGKRKSIRDNPIPTDQSSNLEKSLANLTMMPPDVSHRTNDKCFKPKVTTNVQASSESSMDDLSKRMNVLENTWIALQTLINYKEHERGCYDSRSSNLYPTQLTSRDTVRGSLVDDTNHVPVFKQIDSTHYNGSFDTFPPSIVHPPQAKYADDLSILPLFMPSRANRKTQRGMEDTIFTPITERLKVFQKRFTQEADHIERILEDAITQRPSSRPKTFDISPLSYPTQSHTNPIYRSKYPDSYTMRNSSSLHKHRGSEDFTNDVAILVPNLSLGPGNDLQIHNTLINKSSISK